MNFTKQSRVTVGAIVAVLIALGSYFFFSQSEEPSPQQTVTEAPAPSPAPLPPPVPALPEPEPLELPSLNDSDTVIRGLVAALSSHPGLAAWLVTDDLIRTFVVSVENVANGSNPSRHVQFMKPEARFQTEGAEPELRIADSSYERYDGVSQIIASLDIAGTAKLYHQLLPLMDEAYTELGIPDATFSDALRRAVDRTLVTPIIEGKPRVVPRGPFYEYSDQELQALTAAQKQLLSMGPNNLRVVQDTIRNIATAISFENLPRSSVILR